jgi:hypothetical protein
MRAGFPLIALALCACSMSFDDIETQSDSQLAPDGVDGDFGVAVAAAPLPANIPGVRFVVAGDQPVSLSTYVYDSTGSVTFQGAQVPGLMSPPILRGVVNDLMGNAGELGGGGLVGLSTEADEVVVLFQAGNGELPPREIARLTDASCPQVAGGIADFGADLLLAITDFGDPTEVDLFVVADDRLVIYGDLSDLDEPNPEITCTATCVFDGDLKLVAGNFSNAPGIDLAFVLAEDGATDVAFVEPGVLEARDTLSCVAETLVPGPPGARLAAAGQLEDSTATDELVLVDPVAGLVQTLAVGIAPAPPFMDSALRGTRALEVGNVDDRGSAAEVLAGVPDSPDGDDGFVRAFAVRGNGNNITFELIAALQDSEPQDGQLYGRGIAVGPFRPLAGPPVPVPMIGAAGEVFTVFRPTAEAEDPRE